MKKKVVSMFLAAITVLMLVPMTVFAGSSAEVYRPYDLTLTTDTIIFKEDVNVSDNVTRWDMFILAGTSGETAPIRVDINEFDAEGFKLYEGYCIKANGSSEFPSCPGATYKKLDDDTFEITIIPSKINAVKFLSADNPYIWLVVAPCDALNRLDQSKGTSGHYDVYNSTVCLGKFGSMENFQEVTTTDHAHAFTYTANNGKITATCVDGCDDDYNTNPLTLTLTAPASLVYDGNVKAFTFADGEAAAWTGAGLELPTIIYYVKQSGQSTYMPLLGTLKDAGNYMAEITVNEKTAQVEFAIGKATPYIKSTPEPNDIDYGKKLADSTLYGGYVQVSSTNTTQVGGLFEWTNPDTAPGIDDSEVTLYDVTFTPADTNNYNTVSCKVAVKVNHTHNPVLVNGQAATEDASGWKDYYACDCGKLYEDAEGKVEIADLSKWKAEGGNGYLPKQEEKPIIPDTGDSGRVILWITLLAISFAGFRACFTLGKKRKNER